MDKNSQVTLHVKLEADVSIKEDEENAKCLLIRPKKPLTNPAPMMNIPFGEFSIPLSPEQVSALKDKLNQSS